MPLNIVERVKDSIPVRRALISVSDKTGLDRMIPDLVEILGKENLTIFSTGGTFRSIADILGPERTRSCLVSVADYTGQPEMQGGLVKTLDFKIYLGLLSESFNAAHKCDMDRAGALPIDLVVVNLYPFERTVARADCTPESARTHIDIGGPCMVRAAAKNYLRVGVVTDPADYDAMTGELRESQGQIGWNTRYRWMRKAFEHTARYDTAIAEYFAKREAGQARACYGD